MLRLISVLLVLCGVSNVFSMGHEADHVYRPNSRFKKYIIHTFSFNEREIKHMVKSPNGAAPYGRSALEAIWKEAGFGDPEGWDWKLWGKFGGRIALNINFHRIAKANRNATYLEIKIKSRNDEGGKIGLMILDKAVSLWKKIGGF